MYERIIFAGSGGQGVMTLGKVVARSAMLTDLNCTYLPSYGTEVRGGTANCAVVVSDDEIFSPLVERADVLFAMNDPSYKRFSPRLKPDGLIVVNASMAEPTETGENVLAIPATDIANELGDVRVANVVLLGAYNARRKLLDDDLLFGQLSYAFGGLKGKLLEANKAAYERGAAAASSATP